MDWLFVALGLMLLMGGAEALVRGACGLALLARITPAVVGLTVVAAGTWACALTAQRAPSCLQASAYTGLS